MTTPATIEIEVPDRNEIVIAVPGMQGPTGPPGVDGNNNLFVQNADPVMTEPGLWVQTGLGDDGTGFTFWIEDGV